ncbi:MAG TPA: DUF2117 domain-containing protein [Methanomassiliicoccales archaeon]|nr:DUF2117 domain-containing protein [Methanomassiliicoccales archaeon]
MRLGIVIHGPEVIDTGRAEHLLRFLGEMGYCEVCLGGAMGAAAVIDAGLEDIIDISRREKVSEAMVRLDRTCDVIVVLNHAKTKESGVAFGSIIVKRLPGELEHPAIQLDVGFILPLNRKGEDMARDISSKLKMELEGVACDQFCQSHRIIHGVIPGENVWINGNVIGRALTDKVTIRIDDGLPIFEGVEVKEQGLKKVLPFSLNDSMIRTGRVRRTKVVPRSMDRESNGRIMLIDHCAEDSFFETEDASLAVTVGDDTTRIAGALLYRKGMSIIGITDGDEDGICGEDVFASGSVIIKLHPGNDDILGNEVRERFFGDDVHARLNGTAAELVEMIIEMGGDRIKEILWIGS